MNIGKLAPWNWFRKEEEMGGAHLPVRRDGRDVQAANPIERMRREMDRLFDDFFRGFGVSPPPASAPSFGTSFDDDWFKPSVDISSTDRDYTVVVELPGVSEKDVRIDVAGDTLRIRGEKNRETEDKGRDYYAIERSCGSFQRILALPEDADVDGVSARFKDGVLKIAIPRLASSQTQARQIDVRSD